MGKRGEGVERSGLEWGELKAEKRKRRGEVANNDKGGSYKKRHIVRDCDATLMYWRIATRDKQHRLQTATWNHDEFHLLCRRSNSRPAYSQFC